MSHVTIRDVQTRRRTEMPDSVPILRVPWELSHVRGPCYLEGDVVRYHDESGEHVARTSRARLGDCNPGEVVLVQYDESTRQDPRVWWLCEVCAVNGSDVVHAH